jgi:hypothetical protein
MTSEPDTYVTFAEAQRQCPVHPQSTASIQGTDPVLLFGFEPDHPCITVPPMQIIPRQANRAVNLSAVEVEHGANPLHAGARARPPAWIAP